MPNPYTTLGVPTDADDGTIRRRYLELTREFPPEQHPERFAAVREAYEKVKDIDKRAKHRLIESAKDDPIESIIEEAACRTPRRRVSLQSLLAVALPPPPR